MRVLMVACVGLVLAGCADNPPSRAYIGLSHALDKGELLHRYDLALDSPDFALLNGRMDLHEIFHYSSPACAPVLRDGYPTPEEKIVLNKWLVLREVYIQTIAALHAETLATVASGSTPKTEAYYRALDDESRRSQALAAALVGGKLTYCEFEQEDKDGSEDAHAEADELRREIPPSEISQIADFIAAPVGRSPLGQW